MLQQQVVVGIVEQAGKILLSQRSPNAHLPGFWEFPGGKLEPGETQYQALSRELFEEIGITVVSASFIWSDYYRYDDRIISLAAWWVDRFTGQLLPKEGQPLQWVARERLKDISMPPLNESLVNHVVQKNPSR